MDKSVQRAERVFGMTFASVYPLLVKKVERKGRTQDEVDAVIEWLTGYDKQELLAQLDKQNDYRTFFAEAPCINPHANSITGSICGIRVQDIEDPLMQKIRWLDKLVDELAKGKPLEKILR
ncbi:DUF2200 domain-containing protein [Bifidobacterium aquikefiri]|uniref:DUF2200 domain-containing protein n=1 Tax=Bifidobacterium aquikefiri TaxID=1653207 RepID=A0A261GAQ3_9BIFI|nr:DUF2200 domain-containing protein [Bifidobacterium aquikefiri]OZG68490.1 hypothetical protein BAQU_0308 [Bifidobacterium aquikefiri]